MKSDIKVEEFIIDDTRSFKYGEKANDYITDIDYINFRRMAVNVTSFDKWNGIEVAYLDYLTAVHIIPEDVFLSDIDDNHRWMAFSYYHRDPETHKCDYKTTESRFNDDTPKGRQFHIIQLIMHLAEYEYGIDVEGNSLTKSTITFNSHINYSDDSNEQTWMLIRELMSNFILGYAMIDTYNQLLKEEESMNKDNKLVVGNSFDDVDTKVKTDSDEEQKAEYTTTKSYTVNKTSIGTNYISRLEFVEVMKEAMAEEDHVNFNNDMYNGVPINALMEFIMVGCIPRFVRVHKDFPGMAIVIVDVPSIKNPDEHYERCEFLIKDDVEGGFYRSIMIIITANIMLNYLEVSIDDLDKDINTMALECCNRPNPAWANARFITYLNRKNRLLQVSSIIAQDTDNAFTWDDFDFNNFNDCSKIPNGVLFEQDEDSEIEDFKEGFNNKPEGFKRFEDDINTKPIDVEEINKIGNTYKTDEILKAVAENKKNKHIDDYLDALRYSRHLNITGDTKNIIKKNSNASMSVDTNTDIAKDMENIVVFSYTIGSVSKVSIGKDAGKYIDLLFDDKHTKVSKEFVDKIYYLDDNLINILMLILK